MEYLGLSLASLGQSDRGAAPRTVPAGESSQDFAQAVELAAQPDAAPPQPLVLATPNLAPTLANAPGAQPTVAAPGPVVFDLAAQTAQPVDTALVQPALPNPDRIAVAAPVPQGGVLPTGLLDPAKLPPGPASASEPRGVGVANPLARDPGPAPTTDRPVRDDSEPAADVSPTATTLAIQPPLTLGSGFAAAPTSAPLAAPPAAIVPQPALGQSGPVSIGRPTPAPTRNAPVTDPAVLVTDSTPTAQRLVASDPTPTQAGPIFVHDISALRPAPRLSERASPSPAEPSQSGAQPSAQKPVLSPTQAPLRTDPQTPAQVLAAAPTPTQGLPAAPSRTPGQTSIPALPTVPGQTELPVHGLDLAAPIPRSDAQAAPVSGQPSAITAPVGLRAVAPQSPRPAPVLVALDGLPVDPRGASTASAPTLATAPVASPDRPNGATASPDAAIPELPTPAAPRSDAAPTHAAGSIPQAAEPAVSPLPGKPGAESPPILAAAQVLARPTAAARSLPGRAAGPVLSEVTQSAPEQPAPVAPGTPPAPGAVATPPRANSAIAAPAAVASTAPDPARAVDSAKAAEPVPPLGQPQLDPLRKPGLGLASRMAPHDGLIGTDPSAPLSSTGPLPPAATPPTPGRHAPGTPEFARHVTGQIAHAVADAPGRDHVALRLDPPELGRIDIGMDLRDQTLRVTISTERASTGELIRRHADQLISDFADAGFSGIDLSFAGQNQARRDSLAQSLPQLLAQTLPQPDQPIDPIIAASLDRRQAMAAADSGIDLRL